MTAGVLAAVGVLGAAVATRAGAAWWAGARVAARLPVAAGERPGPAAVERVLDRAGIAVGARAAVRLWIGAVAISLAAATVLGGGPILVAVTVLGPPAALAANQGRAARLRQRQLPLALDTVAASLRGGAALRVAIADAASLGGPLGDELDRVAAHAAAGRPLAETVAEWAGTGGPPVRLAGASLVVAAQLGGPGADAVEATAASLRERAAAEDEITALSVQARLSAGLLAAAPVGFAFLLASLDPTSARFLLTTPAGWACIAGGLILDLLGALWMAHLVRRAR